ncbi:MAG: glycerophosphodiester phosphodiesterase [Pseudomonadota bacterium]
MAATDFAIHLADAVTAVLPRRLPTLERLRACRIVSHRGEHDNRQVLENTLAAFRAASDAGVWGIECDLRWSRDDVPIICHDTDARRVFGQSCVVANTDFSQLRDRLPELPTLAEVVSEFGGRTHIMLEIKDTGEALSDRRKAILRELLSTMTVSRDFHLLALQPALFSAVDFLPREACFPVAELNVADISEQALAGDFGGITGHYLLLGAAIQRQHRAAGQRIGTGFVRSRYGLYRELNRGVEWVFSNHAVHLQALLDKALAQAARAEGPVS